MNRGLPHLSHTYLSKALSHYQKSVLVSLIVFLEFGIWYVVAFVVLIVKHLCGAQRLKTEGYFAKRRTLSSKGLCFNQKRQDLGKPVDNFIMSLRCLMEHCGYGELCEQMIRDRIVVKIQDISFSEKLQLESNLTLEAAVMTVRQRESVKK